MEKSELLTWIHEVSGDTLLIGIDSMDIHLPSIGYKHNSVVNYTGPML